MYARIFVSSNQANQAMCWTKLHRRGMDLFVKAMVADSLEIKLYKSCICNSSHAMKMKCKNVLRE